MTNGNPWKVWKPRFTALAIALASSILIAACSPEQSGGPGAENLFEAAYAHEGAANYAGLDRLYLRQRGENWNPRQGYGPDKPGIVGEDETFLRHRFYDFNGRKHRDYERSTYFGGHDLRFEELYRDGLYYSIPTLMRRYVSSEAQFEDSLSKLIDLPGFVLARAKSAGARLRRLGTRAFGDEELEAISVTWAGRERILGIRPETGDVRAISWRAPDRLTGEREIVQLYEGETRWGELVAPARVRRLVNGEKWSEAAITFLEGDGQIPEATFELDPDLRPAAPGGRAPAPAVAHIAGPVSEVNGLGFNLYRVPFVEFEDFVVVYDAPLASGMAGLVLAKIAEATDGKPVRYVILSHRHTDHIGAVRTFAAAGAEIITTAKTRPMVEALLTAPDSGANSLPEGFAAADVSIIDVGTGEPFEIAGDNFSLLVHNLGRTPHVNDLLVVRLPEEKLVIQADSYFTFSTFGSQFAYFADWAKAMAGEDALVTGVHHGPISLAEIEGRSQIRGAHVPDFLSKMGLIGN